MGKGADWLEQHPEPKGRPPSSEASQFIAVVLILAIGVGAFFAVMWMFNAMVNAQTIKVH